MKHRTDIEYQIAEKVSFEKGRVFYVGGYVRDKLLNIENKDIDIEVYGISVQELKRILSDFGQVNAYGSSFGIFSLANYNLDISMPRKERSYGKGHLDFEVFVDPYMSTYDACKRRDFTMNSIMQDVISGEIIDHFNGVEDIKHKIIRHVNDESFSEDPLRVLRAASFASRFDFKICEETMNLCKNIDISPLSKERVEAETFKSLLNSNKPSLYFENLKMMNQLNYWYPELDLNIHDYSWTETMNKLNKSIAYSNQTDNPVAFMMTVLFCNLYQSNKDLCMIGKAMHRITDNRKIINYVLNMLPIIDKINTIFDKNQKEIINKLFYEAKSSNDLVLLFKCLENDNKSNYLLKQYDEYQKIIAEDYVKGKDLIEMGIKSGKNYSKILDYATNLRLQGIPKEKALSLCIKYAKEIDD